jgi:putative transposase
MVRRLADSGMVGQVLDGHRGCPVTVVQAYRFALDPSPAQGRMLRSHAGAARFAWNWGLARCTERRAAQGRWYSGAELHRLRNAQKKTDPALSWWAQNSKCAYQEAFRDLDRALRDFVKSRNGQREGRRLGFPRLQEPGTRQRGKTGTVPRQRGTAT